MAREGPPGKPLAEIIPMIPLPFHPSFLRSPLAAAKARLTYRLRKPREPHSPMPYKMEIAQDPESKEWRQVRLSKD
jgi:hypothetical protein